MKQSSQSSVASFAQSGNLIACLSQSSTLGPWVLDSGASDHISGNSSLFSHFNHSKSFSSVTLADGTKSIVKAVGHANPLPNLSLDSVIYLPNCPFNLVSVSKLTRALNCSITFTNDAFVIQDQSSGKTIGTGCESQGLYHLSLPSSAACTAIKSPTLLHNCLGHPSLSKL